MPSGEGHGEVRLFRGRPPVGANPDVLRVIPGPQLDWFEDDALAAFFDAPYHLDAASDRRGLRLRGVALRRRQAELPSQGVVPGAVQVPPDGQPIVLGWDGPVTGGYPVIAPVIAADWPRLAQLKPGDAVRFVTIELDAARKLAAGDWDIERLA